MNKFAELMKATAAKYKQNSTIEGELQVKIAGDYIETRMAETYARLQSTAEIKGFRKGKVPANIVKQKFRNDVIRDTFEHLVTETVRGAAAEQKIPLVGEPRVSKTNWLSWKEGDDMEYTARLELVPDPVVKKYKGLAITTDDFEVTDAKVEDTIRQVLESRAELLPVESGRGVRDHDILILDFQGYVDGQAIPDAKADNFMLEVGGPNTMREFQDGVLGMKAGEEREIKVSYPADYNNKEIAGKTVVYKTKLHEIKAKKYPELTDEIAKEFQAESAADLKKKIRDNLEYQARHDEKIQKEERLLAALVEANPMEVPVTLIQYQLNHIIHELSAMLERQKFSTKLIEEYVTRHLDEIQARAEREVKLALLLPKVVEAEKIVVTDADVEKRIELMAQAADAEKDSDRIRKAYAKDEARQNLKSQIARDKAIDVIVENAKITVKKGA